MPSHEYEDRSGCRTVLGDEGIIGGVEGEEPVPVGVEAEQDSSGA